MRRPRRLLRNLVKHPNAGGVLLVSLGCENNDLDHFLPVLGDYDRRRIRTLVTQDMEGDEIEAGLSLMREIAAVMAEDRREECPASRWCWASSVEALTPSPASQPIPCADGSPSG